MLRPARSETGVATNPTIITIIIAVPSVILSIFTANWLNQQHVNKVMEQMDKHIEEQGRRFDAKIDGLRELMSARFDEVGRRFDHIEQRFDGLGSMR